MRVSLGEEVSLNQYEEPVAKSPGQKNQEIADLLAEGAQWLLGLHLSPKGREALAILYGEVSQWYNHQSSEEIRRIIPLAFDLLKKFGQTKET